MSDGTALPRFKRAFVDACASAGVPNVSYQSPGNPADLVGSDGSGQACWFLDEAEGMLDIRIMGGPEIWVDETWRVPFVVQQLGLNSDATQETVDQQAAELLGLVLATFTDPSFGLTSDAAGDVQIQTFAAVPVGAEPWKGGFLSNDARAASFLLSIELTARLRIP